MKRLRPVIVIMGVSGSGKSVVGALLARDLDVPFCEGDDLHPAVNIAKMRAGHALDDGDRAPWLAQIAAWIMSKPNGGVVSCSALKRRYRDRLRRDQATNPVFVLLDPPKAVLEQRLAARNHHFMPTSLLQTQLDTLERPTLMENAFVLSGTETPEDEVKVIREGLKMQPASE